MIGAMDPVTAIPSIVNALSNVTVDVAQMLAERLLIIVLAIFVVGGAGVFIVSAFAWLWIKRVVGDLHFLPHAAHN